MNDRPSVLLIAEACNPEWVSVPLVGYQMYRAIREEADVTLVTQIRNRAALERAGVTGRSVAFIDSERLASPFHKLGMIASLGRGLGWTARQAAMWLPYLYFERLVYRRFRVDLAEGRFDVIHRVTPLTPTYPSPLASWTRVPMILGPLNGGLPWPRGTTRVRLAEREWMSYVRGAHRFLPYVRSTYARAACVIAGSRYTRSALPASTRGRCVSMPENGIDPSRFHALGRTPPSLIRPFRLLFVGRLVPYKGAHLLLRAVAGSSALSHCEVVLVGDGPQRSRLESMVVELKLADRVRFEGRRTQSEVVAFYRDSSVFVFPSLREFGGAVVLEAMACGLPGIVLDYGGPAEYVDDQVGYRIPVASAEEIVDRLRSRLERLVENPQILDRWSVAGVQRVQSEYLWSVKARRVVDWYGDVIAGRLRDATSPAGVADSPTWD